MFLSVMCVCVLYVCYVLKHGPITINKSINVEVGYVSTVHAYLCSPKYLFKQSWEKYLEASFEMHFSTFPRRLVGHRRR